MCRSIIWVLTLEFFFEENTRYTRPDGQQQPRSPHDTPQSFSREVSGAGYFSVTAQSLCDCSSSLPSGMDIIITTYLV